MTRSVERFLVGVDDPDTAPTAFEVSEPPTEGACFANPGTDDPRPLVVPANLDDDIVVVRYAGTVERDRTGVEIDASSEVGASATLAVGRERSVRVAGEVVASGFSVGAEVSATLGSGVGEGTSCTGNVGELDRSSPDFGPDDLHRYGVMTCTEEGHASGREFRVVDGRTERADARGSPGVDSASRRCCTLRPNASRSRHPAPRP